MTVFPQNASRAEHVGTHWLLEMRKTPGWLSQFLVKGGHRDDLLDVAMSMRALMDAMFVLRREEGSWCIIFYDALGRFLFSPLISFMSEASARQEAERLAIKIAK